MTDLLNQTQNGKYPNPEQAEIAALRAKNARLMEALEKITGVATEGCGECGEVAADEMYYIAREALEVKP